MKPEIEAKFLRIDHDAIRACLQELGAVCVHKNRLMKRKNFDFADKSLDARNGWVRVRDEGDKITLSYKQMADRSLHGTQEISLTVDGFEAAEQFLNAIGLHAKVYEESRRESWRLGDVEIELDEWPWVPPFLEIEGPSEEVVRETAGKLGLDWAHATHGSVEIVYTTEYDVTEEEVCSWPEVTFGPVSERINAKRRQS